MVVETSVGGVGSNNSGGTTGVFLGFVGSSGLDVEGVWRGGVSDTSHDVLRTSEARGVVEPGTQWKNGGEKRRRVGHTGLVETRQRPWSSHLTHGRS